MNKFIDAIINLCRWPVALILLWSLPALLKSFRYFNFMAPHFYFFGAGILFFWIIAFTAGREIRVQIQTIAHELTHTLFAFLTLHFIRRIRLNPDGSGGSMAFAGHGNWLITLAPYFFPLFAFFYMLLMPWLLNISDSHWLVYAVFGYFVAYYWETVLSQVHSEQTDIIKEGYFFSGIIIVGLNLLVNGAIFAFTSKLWGGVEQYLLLLTRLCDEQWHRVQNLFT
ncbi:MAG: M50 family metallopeptidase [Alphaproteobacteria bacterium]|nr:M50 family metallopeptidase [Alphaproteobacteria bacterium]